MKYETEFDKPYAWNRSGIFFPLLKYFTKVNKSKTDN